MSVWLTIPSARENGGTAQLWKERGYRIALWRDREGDGTIRDLFSSDGLVIVAQYPGYAKAVNALTNAVFRIDPKANWCVAGGDDIEPDPTHDPETIAKECEIHFGGGIDVTVHGGEPRFLVGEHATFGVMQPTADRWGERPELGNLHPMHTAYIDRVCGSAWLGREWCARANKGLGPLHPAFFHMFVDEFLQQSALRVGVLWQRPDLLHLHRHWARQGIGEGKKTCPEFLTAVSGPEHWKKAQAVFDDMASRHFADGDPLPYSETQLLKTDRLDEGDPDFTEIGERRW